MQYKNKIWTLITFTMLLVLQLNAQDENLVVTNIGGSLDGNIICHDDELTLLELTVFDAKVNQKTGKIKLLGQAANIYGDVYPNIQVFLGCKNLNNNEIQIVDTLYSFNPNMKITRLNKKKFFNNLEGIFKIKAKPTGEQAIYIISPGCITLEVAIKE